MAQRNRQEGRSRRDRDLERFQGRQGQMYGRDYGREEYGRDDRDRYYEEGVGLQNLGHPDDPWWHEHGQRSQGNYDRGQEDYSRNQQNYGRTQHFDESIAGRPSGFEGSYGYRAGSQSQFGTGGRFSNFGVGRNTAIGQSGYGSSDSGRGFGRSNFNTGESWRSQFDTGNYSGRGPKGYRRSDERIREEVCEALTFDPFVDASEIEIVVLDGNVTLSGNVDDRNQKRRAEETVENVSGVRDITNNVRSKNSQFGSEIRSDQQTATQTGKESKRAA